MPRKQKKPPIVISLSGGGDRTYYLAGLVYGLSEKFTLKHVNVVSGSSYAIPITLKAKSVSSALSRMVHFSILNFLERIPSDKVLEEHGLFKLKPEIYSTLEILTGVKDTKSSIFTPVGTEITKQGLFPVFLENMRYGKAAAISMSFPYLIAPTKVRGKYITDGGVAGSIHFENLEKYKGKVPIIGIYILNEHGTGTLVQTIYRGLKNMNIDSLGAIKDLYKLYKDDRILEPIRKMRIPRFSKSNIANITYIIKGITEPLILPHTSKKKLFLEGYLASQVLISSLSYYVNTGEWKKVQGKEVYLDRKNLTTPEEDRTYFAKEIVDTDFNEQELDAKLEYYLKGLA